MSQNGGEVLWVGDHGIMPSLDFDILHIELLRTAARDARLRLGAADVRVGNSELINPPQIYLVLVRFDRLRRDQLKLIRNRFWEL